MTTQRHYKIVFPALAGLEKGCHYHCDAENERQALAMAIYHVHKTVDSLQLLTSDVYVRVFEDDAAGLILKLSDAIKVCRVHFTEQMDD